MRTPLTLLFCAVVPAVFLGCDKEDVVQPVVTDLRGVLIQTTSVIVSTYRDLDDKSALLVDAVAALQADPTPVNLERARDAWRAARVPWEHSEAFLFGPVTTHGIDPSIDSWPVNTVDLDAVLASTDSLTRAYVDALEGTLKGFHTIEYLLFGTGGNKTVSEFTVRQYQYLVAVSRSLKGQTALLVGAWDVSGEDFGGYLIRAGENGNVYFPSQQAALEELVTGMLTIADEVANGKINDPYAQSDVTLEESRFSANSKADFQDNIRGILLVYAGDPQTPPETSIRDLVRRNNEALDARVTSSIHSAIEKIGAIPGTFSTAIVANRPAVQEAQTSVRNLQSILESELLPFIREEVR
jgi:uncharacterized iron-regulated protein